MTKVSDILNFLEQYAPYNLAESWDNNGLLVGDLNSPVTKTLVALDVTNQVIDEAILENCSLIIAHHPVIFTKVNSVTNDDITGNMIIKCIKNDISIICMHTNLDCTNGGVNDALAQKLELLNIETLGAGDSGTLGRVGTLKKELDFLEFILKTKQNLNANGIKYVGNNPVKKVAVLGGSGGKLIDFAIKNGADTYVTADCSYDVFQKAQNMNINLIDAGHFATENVICDILIEKLKENFNTTFLKSTNHKDIISFI